MFFSPHRSCMDRPHGMENPRPSTFPLNDGASDGKLCRMRNFNDSFMPQRFRLPEKDTRRFYEKPEWWVEFVKWGIIAVLLIGAAGFGISFAMGKWKERRQRLEAAAQEARLREHEEAKEREAKEAREKAEKEAREKARAEAKAEKERIRREKQEAEEKRRAEKEQRRLELASREKGPRHIADLEKKQETAGVRWWGKGEPPKFADRKEGDEYWCIFVSDSEETMVRVKVGADKNAPAAIELVDGEGYMRKFERELLDDAIAQRPHLVMMDRAAWVRPPAHMVEKAAHMSIPNNLPFRPAEVLLGERLYRILNNRFSSDNRLYRLICNVEFHWRGESHPPISWQLKFDEAIGSSKLYRAIEDALQAELDATNAAAAKKGSARQSEGLRASSGLSGGGTLGGSHSGGGLAGGSRSGRRLGEGGGSSGGLSAKQERSEPPRKERVTRDDVQRVIEEGYLSASFAE